MKNIQVIDGANNASYDIWEITDELFELIFPNEGQNVEFIEDFTENIWSSLPKDEQDRLYKEWWSRPVPKSQVQGIDGTLFYELRSIKSGYYPNKRESDLNARGRIGWDHP